MVVTHTSSTPKKWQVKNLYKFQPKKGSIIITFHKWNVEHNSKVWGIFLLRWIFKISSNIYSSRGQIQDCICYKLGGFIWKVISFRVKNGPLAYQKTLTKTFKEYLDSFMKIFLDDFTGIVTWKVICRSSNNVFKSAKNMALV
jgi:hypothetical protein